jgi:hypothetical protein
MGCAERVMTFFRTTDRLPVGGGYLLLGTMILHFTGAPFLLPLDAKDKCFDNNALLDCLVIVLTLLFLVFTVSFDCFLHVLYEQFMVWYHSTAQQKDGPSSRSFVKSVHRTTCEFVTFVHVVMTVVLPTK